MKIIYENRHQYKSLANFNLLLALSLAP
jgi:hypothetical protein